jgi:hypothetical protein
MYMYVPSLLPTSPLQDMQRMKDLKQDEQLKKRSSERWIDGTERHGKQANRWQLSGVSTKRVAKEAEVRS